MHATSSDVYEMAQAVGDDGVGDGLIWTHPAPEQVIGKARGVGSFALPGTYRIPGARSTAAISQHRQRQQYVRRHQALRAGLPAPNPNSGVHVGDPDLHFDCGGAHQEHKGPAFRSLQLCRLDVGSILLMLGCAHKMAQIVRLSLSASDPHLQACYPGEPNGAVTLCSVCRCCYCLAGS